ncbi:hypothetical protein F2I39_23575 [Escherichia coli]|nr:hypothetical protein [Escherichia coli]EFN9662260.1 hypothetical protein [Escherichia coli]
MGCCSGVVTQAYGQPDNPVLSRGKDSLAIRTAAPFRGVPQPEAHGRRCQWHATEGEITSPCAFALCPDFSGIYPFSKLSVPDSYPCPAHDNTLSRVVSILNQ